MGESESNYQGPPGGYDAYLHEVTLNSFQISETETQVDSLIHLSYVINNY